MLEPDTSHSTSPNDTAVYKAFNFKGSLFEFMELTENKRQREIYGAAMRGITTLAHPDSILEGIDIHPTL